jgi:hypothetical protein
MMENMNMERSKECGVYVSDMHSCIIRHSTFKHCVVAALESYNYSNVEVTDREFIETGDYAFQAFTGGVLTAKGCSITSAAKKFVQDVVRRQRHHRREPVQQRPRAVIWVYEHHISVQAERGLPGRHELAR